MPEAVFLKEFPDTTIKLSLVDQPEVTASGTVREVSLLVDPFEDTVRVRLSVTDNDKLLPIGAAVRGTAQTRTTQEFSVPWIALDSNHKRPIVWVTDPVTGKVRQNSVKVTRYESDEIIIGEGLEDGDCVVVSGRQFVMSGERLAVNGERENDVGRAAGMETGGTSVSDGANAEDTGADANSGGTVMVREENELGFTLSGRLVSREVSVGDGV